MKDDDEYALLETPKIFPWGMRTILILMPIFLFANIVVFINENLRSVIIVILLISLVTYIGLRLILRAEVRAIINIQNSIKQYWPKWKDRIETELNAKQFVTDEDLQIVADKLNIKTRMSNGKLEPLDLVLKEYESKHSEYVVYAYIYTKKTGSPLKHSIIEGYSYPKKVLALRSRFPPGRYDYSIERRVSRIK